MDSKKFNGLWPDFKILFTEDLLTLDGISALFIATILVLFIGSILYMVFQFIKTLKDIQAINRVISKLSKEEVFQNQRDIHNKISKIPRVSSQWFLFENSLIQNPKEEKIYQTTDPSYYFSAQNLYKDVYQNRLLAAIPGTLTTIGVIGTFFGLQVGLSMLNLSTGVDSNSMRTGIGHMISGSSVAFLTSLWGVFTNLWVNLVEKFTIRIIDKKCDLLVSKLNFLYVPINSDANLHNLTRHSEDTANSLVGMSESIGRELQKAIGDSNESFRQDLVNCLNEIMAPAIESLVSHSSNQSEKALESLLEKFIENIGGAGKQQQELFMELTEGIKNSIGSIDEKLNSFLLALDEKANLWTQNAKKDQERFESHIDHFQKEAKNFSNSAKVQYDQSIQSIKSVFDQHLKDSYSNDQVRRNEFDSHLKQVFDQQQENFQNITKSIDGSRESLQKEVSEHIGSLMSGLESSSDRLFKSIFAIEENFTLIKSASDQVSTDIESWSKEISKTEQTQKNMSTELKQVSGNLNTATANMMAVSEKFKSLEQYFLDNFQKMIKDTYTINEGSLKIHGEISKSITGFQTISSDVAKVVGQLDGSTKSFEAGFTKLEANMNQFLKGFKTHVKTVEEELLQLLNSYAENVQSQTNERLSVWNDQTGRYLNTMTDAIQSISDVVDEIEIRSGASSK